MLEKRDGIGQDRIHDWEIQITRLAQVISLIPFDGLGFLGSVLKGSGAFQRDDGGRSSPPSYGPMTGFDGQ